MIPMMIIMMMKKNFYFQVVSLPRYVRNCTQVGMSGRSYESLVRNQNCSSGK